MHRRFCSPHVGRFFSPDELKRYEPLRARQLYNRYSYGVGNSVNFVDPDGLRPLRATELQFFSAFFGGDFSTVDVKGGFACPESRHRSQAQIWTGLLGLRK